MEEHKTPFKLDSGAKVTVVGDKTPWLKKMKLTPAREQFRGPGGVPLSHLVVGIKVIDVNFKINGHCEVCVCYKGPAK